MTSLGCFFMRHAFPAFTRLGERGDLPSVRMLFLLFNGFTATRSSVVPWMRARAALLVSNPLGVLVLGMQTIPKQDSAFPLFGIDSGWAIDISPVAYSIQQMVYAAKPLTSNNGLQPRSAQQLLLPERYSSGN